MVNSNHQCLPKGGGAASIPEGGNYCVKVIKRVAQQLLDEMIA